MYESIRLPILFFSLNLLIAVITLYELHYRKRIEQNRPKIVKFCKSELRKLVKEIKIPIPDKEYRKTRDVGYSISSLDTLMGRPDDFLRWRNWMLVPIVLEAGVLGIISAKGATVNVGWLQLFGFISAISIFSSIYYLHAIWSVDYKIREIKVKTKNKLLNNKSFSL
jgi:hypothetical protein